MRISVLGAIGKLDHVAAIVGRRFATARGQAFFGATTACVFIAGASTKHAAQAQNEETRRQAREK